MSTDPKRYRPPFLTQRAVDSTLNDCRGVATLHGVADATSGEAVTTARGQEMSQATLRRLCRRMLKSIGHLDTSGGLDTTDTRDMIARVWPKLPIPTVITIDFPEMKRQLIERKAGFSISGVPSRIKGDSPIKRTSVPHEFYVSRASRDGSKLLVYDGMRPAGKDSRGEWRPAEEVRQFAFKDSDGELVGVVRFPIGAWRAQELVSRDRIDDLVAQRITAVRRRDQAVREADTLRALVDEQKDRIVELEAESAAVSDDCIVLIDTALRNEREDISDLVLARSEG